MTGYSTPSPSHHEPALHPSTRGQSCPTHCTGTAISTPRTWLKEPACPTPCASTRPDGHQEGLRPRAVRVHGKRINSCLALAAMKADCLITVSEGIAQSNNLHALQTAFIEHDAFQCGYCAPGQICSGVGLLNEGRAKTTADIRELVSSNICRCGAFTNLLTALEDVTSQYESISNVE